uniref:Uncharacterized protein n=1 Tax=Vespula pensylvanica TaxID=30213 RepID=A0A834KHW7_VESPE|nr:hypothetical protein H0235_014584 [Vespula pensylvanica]
MGRERVWIGNVNAKQRQLEQRRDVDCSQSVKPRGRKNALINSARNGARTNAPDYTNITKESITLTGVLRSNGDDTAENDISGQGQARQYLLVPLRLVNLFF